jgi:hypothetical protein
MRRRWLCRVGWHKWVLQATEDGDRYHECARCRKVDSRGTAPPGTSFIAGGSG